MNRKPKLFLVLALHRSGSSATAGVMKLLDVNMGKNLLVAGLGNPKGHFENKEFVTLNEQILTQAGGKWNCPIKREEIKKVSFSEEKIKQFINNNKDDYWGLKDPRTLLTFEVIHPFLKDSSDITYVFVHRPFEQSVRSLSRRNIKISLEESSSILKVYLENFNYYRNLLEMGQNDIIDVSFSDLIKDPQFFCKEINQRMNQAKDYNLDKVKEFLVDELKHF